MSELHKMRSQPSGENEIPASTPAIQRNRANRIFLGQHGLSLILCVAHAGNSGEALLGLIGVFAAGLLACLMLRRTGDLWFPIGFHFSWDYAESFIFGVPDSGNVAAGHLLGTHMHGSKWLTGGSVGPEGSALAFAVLGLRALAFHRVYPSARMTYPRPAISGVRNGQT